MRRRHGERGATLVESAIVLTVLLTLMFGIVDFGRALYTYTFVDHLARQGARWAIVRGSLCTALTNCPAQQGASDVQPYVRSLSEGATDPSQVTATLDFPASCNSTGCPARVTVSYPFNFLLPFVSSATITMTSSSQMVISQ